MRYCYCRWSVTGGIAWKAVLRFRHPSAVEGMTVIVVAAFGVAINLGTALLFMVGRKGDRMCGERSRIFSLRIVEEYYPAFSAHLAERAGNCRVMCNASSRITANADVSKRLLAGVLRVVSRRAPSRVQLQTSGGFAPVAGRGAWPKVPRCWSMKSCPNRPCANGC